MRIVIAFSCFFAIRLCAAETTPSAAQLAALSAPTASHIPAGHLASAINQAAANGVATLIARTMAEGNDLGLAYPPLNTPKLIAVEKVPARLVKFEVPTYKYDYDEVEQLVPEMSNGKPTGRFIRGKVRVLVKQTKTGTTTIEKLVADPKGTALMDRGRYGPGGPDIYEPNTLGFNGMALYVLATAGQQKHPATSKIATALCLHMDEVGISDHTFDVGWLAAGLMALGPDSKYRDWADQLIAKLIDGQIREPGEAQGLWGPVCIHSSYFTKLYESQEGLRLELEVNLPKRLEMATPQQQAALVKQGQQMRKFYGQFTRAYTNAASSGTRMLSITHANVMERMILPGLPFYAYNRVVADVESTTLAAFVLAEAKRLEMLPKETPRIAIRGKKIHPAEKTAAALTLAAKKLSACEGADGGFSGLTFQAVNTAFEKSRLPIPNVPFKDSHPSLIDLETACTCVIGHAGLSLLAEADPAAMLPHAEKLERARGRSAAIAERWYRESAKGFTTGWESVYKSLLISKAALTSSASLPFPPHEPLSVEKLRWGGYAAPYEIVPGFASLFSGSGSKAEILQDGLYRQLAYRLIGLQDANGQWMGVSIDLLSSGRNALALNDVAAYWHKGLNSDPPLAINGDPITYDRMVVPLWAYHAGRSLDGGAFPTLASLLFLLKSVDGPVDIRGISLSPDPPSEQPVVGSAAEPKRLTPIDAVKGVVRPNAARTALYDAVLISMQLKPADVLSPKPAANAAKPKGDGDSKPEEPGEELGDINDLIDPSP
ncbi:MAG: hypothetical protein WCP23_05160 [Planctomycetota bacterium]